MDNHFKLRNIFYCILLAASFVGFLFQFVLPMVEIGRSPLFIADSTNLNSSI